MRQNLLFAALLLSQMMMGQVRREMNLKTWEFSRDNSSWEQVEIPHDWAIAGPFDKKWDLQRVAITQNGETEATEKSGRSGSLPWIGEGWYRTTVDIPAGYEAAELVFDGAMAEPRVSINGREAGYWAYGYNAFRVDATPYIGKGKLDIGVHLQNVEESSRWYPGAGLYRPVKLVLTKKTHIDEWGIFVRTMSIDQGKAVVEVEAQVVNPDKSTAQVSLTGPDGHTVGSSGDTRIEPDGKVYARFQVKNPQLWSPETPYLYQVKVEVYQGHHELQDSKTVKTGLRTVRVGREHGFQLNGVSRKIKGVCLHHDLGPLGAAINKTALIRQIRMMKEMGCDAIRTSHNMPSTWQMEICDSMGMMVMAESFDMWLYPKCKNGYARFFREWAAKDITNLILNHRNHPSIVMWSIGNEIPEQWSEEGRQISIRLQGLCHSLDPTRPVTQGMDRAEDALRSGFAQAMEVPGFNYRVHKYENNIKQLPQGFLLGSETASTVSSRGVYKFPVVPNDNSRFASYSPHYDPTALEKADGQCSSYDVEWCSWSNLPDDDWRCQDDYPWVIGEFVWTGYDYLGEPTPYDEYWPSRSSYFGICDLAGLPKDRYWLYRSRWNRDEHTIHLLPHWSWGKQRRGKVTPVYCYTDYPTAELFLGGTSPGKISKNPASRLDRDRLRWTDVKYEPGRIEAVARTGGKEVARRTLETADKAVRLEAAAENADDWKGDGQDLLYVHVTAVDEAGRRVRAAADAVKFEVSGAATLLAVDDGDERTDLLFRNVNEKALRDGSLLVILRSKGQPGEVTLKVTSAAFAPLALDLKTQR